MDKKMRELLHEREMNEINNMLDIVRNASEYKDRENGYDVKNFPKMVGDREFFENCTYMEGKDTGLPCTVIFDEGELYKQYHHPLALFIVDGDFNNDNTPVIPVTIEDKPRIYGNTTCTQEIYGFIQRNKKALIDVANFKIYGDKFFDIIEADRENQERINNTRYSYISEMSILGKDTTGISTNIYVDDTGSFMRSGHNGSYRIKYQQDPNIGNPNMWMPITIPDLEVMDKENIPPRRIKLKYEKQVIEWAKLNLQLLMDLRDKKIDGKCFKYNCKKYCSENIILDSEINNNK